jgi:arylsulfatase A-like enzyme
MIEQLDDGIGRVISALAKAGRLDRTIIVFAGDNGLSMGSHGLMGKQSPYEHALRVPMIIAGPGLAAGRKNEGLASNYDLMPTVLDLAGVPMPADLDGRSLKPVLTGQSQAIRDRLSMSVYLDNLDAHVLREGPWKLIRYPYLDRTQLFNLTEDPHELRDLSAATDHESRIAAMMKSLATEMSAAGVKKPLTTDRRIPTEVDWSKVTQKMDDQQPDWIRQRFSLPPNQ